MRFKKLKGGGGIFTLPDHLVLFLTVTDIEMRAKNRFQQNICTETV